MKYFNYLLAMLLFLLPVSSQAAEYPFTFNDSAEKTITLQKQPQRVVSLVPSVTEMLLRIGVDEAVTGITYHSTLPPQTAGKEIIGGFFRPNLDRVAACKPDVIFYADLQKDIPDRFAEQATLIQLTARSIEESFDHIRLLGRIFDRTIKAEEIIAEEKRQLSVIQDKIAGIPQEQKQRVMRLMGRDSLMAPGDNSFQNEYIQAAGGIAPEFGKKGSFSFPVISPAGLQPIPVTLFPGLLPASTARSLVIPLILSCPSRWWTASRYRSVSVSII
jgi:ABC-type Fe3+-hydroxamate transport system substrate-binding protein